jgi:hypothetical protein
MFSIFQDLVYYVKFVKIHRSFKTTLLIYMSQSQLGGQLSPIERRLLGLAYPPYVPRRLVIAR